MNLKHNLVSGTTLLALSMALALSIPASDAVSPVSNQAAKTTANSELVSGKISQKKKRIGSRDYHVARAIVNSSPEHVWSYLTDYRKAPKVFTNLKKIRLLDQKANRKKVQFQVTSLGGLMKFDYVLHVKETEPSRIEWTRASGAFKRNEGFWLLKPINHGKQTLVVYGKHVDGGMFMPKMIVDKQLKSTMPNVIKNLRSAVAEDRKRIAQRSSAKASL